MKTNEQLLKELPEESSVAYYLKLRDSIIEMIEYDSDSGYGAKHRVFIMEDCKNETILIEKLHKYNNKWSVVERMGFDTDSYKYFAALIKGEGEKYKEYRLVRDYNERFTT